MTAEIALRDLPFFGAIEECAPRFQLPDPIRGLFCMKLSHTPVVEELPTAHRVAKVHLPAIIGIDVTHCGCGATLRHHGMGLAEERLTDDRNRKPRFAGLDRGAKACAAGADHKDVVLESVLTHWDLHL